MTTSFRFRSFARKFVASSLFFAGLATWGSASSVSALSYEWETRGPLGVRFSDVATSADGQIAYAVSDPLTPIGKIFKTSDSGITWTETTAPALQWTSIDCSSDGQKIFAVGKFSSSQYKAYSSQDGGLTWDWQVNTTLILTDGRITSDGKTIATSGRTGTTTNGLNFRITNGSLVTNGIWESNYGKELTSLALSEDGSTLFATVYGGQIFSTTKASNFQTWSTYVNAPGNWYWNKIRVSDNGQVIFGTGAHAGGARTSGTFGGVYSTDAGMSWNSTDLENYFGNLQATEIGMSRDGQTMIAASYYTTGGSGNYGMTRISRDGGSTWADGDSFGQTGRQWMGFDVSDDGSVIYGVTENYGINILRRYSAPTISLLSATSGSVDGGETIVITGSSFTSNSTVSFGNVLATDITVVSPTRIEVVVPANSAGQVSVTVTTANGSSSYNYNYISSSNTNTNANAPKSSAAITGAPKSAKYTSGNKRAILKWSKVAGATAYVVVSKTGKTVCQTSKLTCTVTSLRNGAAQTFNIYSVNVDTVRSTQKTSLNAWAGFQVKKTSVKKSTEIQLSSILTTPSKGKRTWKIFGPCRFGLDTVIAPAKAGSCTLQLRTLKNGRYPTMNIALKLTVK